MSKFRKLLNESVSKNQILDFALSHLRKNYTSAIWAEGGCVNLAYGICKFLKGKKIPCVVEKSSGGGFFHYRCRSNWTILDSSAGHTLSKKFTKPFEVVGDGRPVVGDYSDSGVDQVMRDFEKSFEKEFQSV